MLILVGRNAQQNDTVTFRQAVSHDTWLHARGVPGAHVAIVNGGRRVAQATLRRAAELAAYYSASREAASVPVDCTLRRYVRRIKRAGPGMVTYREEKTLSVAPRK